MKRFLAVAMSVAMVFGVAACSSNSTPKVEDKKTEEAPAKTDGGVLKMGCSADFPPFESYDDDGKTIVGYDVDMMNEICSRLGMTLEITDMNFDSVVTAVQTGKIDVGVSGMTITDERKANVNFSDSYFTAAQSILVPKDSKITGYQALLDGTYKAGVQLGTTGDIMAVEKLGDRVSEFEKYGDALAALLAGKVDCMVLDTGVAEAYAQANDLVVLDETFGDASDIEYYGIAISKDNTELLDKINGALADMKTAGFFDELNQKYAG
ncbi:Arginine-binding extracellular protein ArtP [bioreactor metagenome]|uniref:Arginine-binding extracellular protein ArtP n=1 Tax=bioreactor metagenome TaxID=1076179 RepID=A0A644ZVR6_9ZZZZ|nr:basic amino acid ABC transporter substrate-binding protein [Candidatus Metalachnospira sp.]